MLSCVELLEGRAEKEVIKNILPALLGAMGDSRVRARPSEMIRGLIFASDLAQTAGAVLQVLISGVKEVSYEVEEAQRGLDASESVFPKNELFPERQLGVVINPSTCKGPNIQQAKRCPMFRRCESEFKSHLCDDQPKGLAIHPVVCAVCGRPLIVSPEDDAPDARGSYNPMAACNYCKRQGRLEDLKRGD